MPNQTITIPTAQTTSTTSSKPYTVYNIHLKSALRTTVLPKRYSEFEALHHSLHAETGSYPPEPLPGKSWLGGLGLGFGKTVGNEKLTEERRQGLEKYVKSIVEGSEGKWRESKSWRSFMGEKSAGGASNGDLEDSKSARGEVIRTGAQWLDVHRDLKAKLHDARLALNKRESAQTPTAQHESSAEAKQNLVRAGTLIASLDSALDRLKGDSWNGLGEGEVRRRRDMLAAARKEREGLEGVLNSLAVRSAVAGVGAGAKGEEMAHQLGEQGLFSTASTNASPFHSSANHAASSSRRVLGAPLKETERTRELDNEGVLQLQKHIMQEQELDVRDLTKVVGRMKEMGVAINEELVEQNQLLGLLDQDVDRVQGKVDVARKRVSKIH